MLLPIFDTALTASNQLAQMTRSFPAHQNAAFQNHQALVHVHGVIDNMTQAMQMFTHHNQAGIEEVKKVDPRSRVQDLIQLEEASTQFTNQLGEQLQLLKSSLPRDVSFEVVRNMHLLTDTAYVAGQCQSFFQVAATHLAWPQQSAFAIVAEGMQRVNPQVPPFVPPPRRHHNPP